MPELFVRPSLEDHKVLADLLAPRHFGESRPIDRLVLNAHDAARNEQLIEAARHSGTPLLIDPVTVLLQSETGPDDPWVRCTPYGRASAVSREELAAPFFLDELVSSAVEFQVEHGATAVIAPYFYCEGPDSPAFAASLAAITKTARRMRLDGISLPLVVVLCAKLRTFARRAGWTEAIDRFAATAIDVGPQMLGLQLSPVGDGAESYEKLHELMAVAQQLRSAGRPVIAWRQGVYGPALVAVGLDGYECGIGVGEQSNVRGFMTSRKPREKTGGFGGQGIYMHTLRRSVPLKVAAVLLADRRLRSRLVCDSPRCCPRGAESMLASTRRSHAVRARARDLRELAEIPNEAWRLNHIEKQAASAYLTATKANELLHAAGLPNSIKTQGFQALEEVAAALRDRGPGIVRETA